jgi:hypothetical protein
LEREQVLEREREQVLEREREREQVLERELLIKFNLTINPRICHDHSR